MSAILICWVKFIFNVKMSFSNAPCEDQFLVENTCTSIDALIPLYSGVKFILFWDFVQLVEDLPLYRFWLQLPYIFFWQYHK